MIHVLKYLFVLNSCLALVGWGSSELAVRKFGSQAYMAGAMATLVVATSASLALVLTYVLSRPSKDTNTKDTDIDTKAVSSNNAVAGMLLAMLFRMGFPLASIVFLTEMKSPLLAVGFYGILTVIYLVALPLEITLSLRLLPKSKATGTKAAVAGDTDSSDVSSKAKNCNNAKN